MRSGNTSKLTNDTAEVEGSNPSGPTMEDIKGIHIELGDRVFFVRYGNLMEGIVEDYTPKGVRILCTYGSHRSPAGERIAITDSQKIAVA